MDTEDDRFARYRLVVKRRDELKNRAEEIRANRMRLRMPNMHLIQLVNTQRDLFVCEALIRRLEHELGLINR
jgi:hypothetical protein